MAIRFVKNIWSYWRQLIDKDVLIVADAGVPVDGVIGTGTGASYAGPGSLYVDTTNKKLYINGGTKASPAWKQVTSA